MPKKPTKEEVGERGKEMAGKEDKVLSIGTEEELGESDMSDEEDEEEFEDLV